MWEKMETGREGNWDWKWMKMGNENGRKLEVKKKRDNINNYMSKWELEMKLEMGTTKIEG